MRFLMVLALILVSPIIGIPTVSAGQAQKAEYTIRWSLAHWPPQYFRDTAEDFKRRVEAGTGGNVTVKIIEKTPRAGESRTEMNQEFLGKVQKGELEMAQIYSNWLAELEPEMHVMSLPYLFRDHNHLTNVAEGPIGEYLMAGLSSHGLKGLAFTYSGGFVGTCAVSKEIQSYKDYKGLRYRAIDEPVSRSYLRQLQTVPIASQVTIGNQRPSLATSLQRSITDAGDCIYADAADVFYTFRQRPARVLNRTDHRLITTMLVLNERFWKSLPQQYRRVVRQAALHAARGERNRVVIDEKKTIAKLERDPKVKVVQLSKRAKQEFRQAMQPVYLQFAPVVGAPLIRKIEQAPSTAPKSLEDMGRVELAKGH